MQGIFNGFINYLHLGSEVAHATATHRIPDPEVRKLVATTPSFSTTTKLTGPTATDFMKTRQATVSDVQVGEKTQARYPHIDPVKEYVQAVLSGTVG